MYDTELCKRSTASDWETLSQCLRHQPGQPHRDRNVAHPCSDTAVAAPMQARHSKKCGWYFWLAVVTKKLRADLGGGGGLWL